MSEETAVSKETEISDDTRRASGASVGESVSDPGATAAALEAVGRAIATHDRDHALSEPIPESVADRLDETLAYLSRGQDHGATAPAFDPPTGAGGRRGLFATSGYRRALVAAAAVAAVAIAVPVVITRVSDGSSDDPGTVAGPESISESTGNTPIADLIAGALGQPVGGPLADPVVREQCLSANGVAPQTPILGSREITLGETPGTLFVLPGIDTSHMVALVVGADCAADNPALLSRTDIG